MLLEKPIAKNDIVTMKLLTGEEVIACFESESDTNVVVQKPATIAQGPQGMGIVPWMITSRGEKVTLNRNAVIAICPTEPEIAKSYTEATTSIQIVN